MTPAIVHPQIDEATYQEILSVLHNMAIVMERSPSAFNELREEQLRMHFLVQLNGVFKGEATGETFNFNGKTDILLRKDGRNIFIGECKFWNGPKAFNETIDQLLNYLTWRDSKSAIILYVRDTKLSTVLDKIPLLLQNHSNSFSEPKDDGEGRFRIRMKSNRDDTILLDLTVLVYHVP